MESDAEPPTQVEATQVEVTQEVDYDEFDESAEPAKPAIVAWARLMPLDRSRPHIDLLPSGEDASNYSPGVVATPLYTHIIGRSQQCDVIYEHVRISNRHCKIYCERERENSPLEVFIEDSSANGTFINKTIKLQKGTRRLLHTGDEISLISANATKKGAAPSPEEVEKMSFIVQIMLPQRTSTKQGQPNPFSHLAEMGRATTLVRLLDQGRTITDTYDIQQLLGKGTCGDVHLAIERQTGKRWAVKCINFRKHAFGSTSNIDELIQEAELLRSLSHPHIIQLKDIFADEEHLYLVMELVRGGDLFDRVVARGRYDEQAAKLLAKNLLDALQYLHSHDIMHRDLKPENILLVDEQDDVNVKITDFGLAKRMGADGLKTFCGTPQYFAPEVLRRQDTVQGMGRYGKAADMWSIGVILYVLLSGSMPFADENLYDDVANARFSMTGRRWEGVSEAAQDLIRKLLLVDPSLRLTAEHALRHSWFADVVDDSSGSSSTDANGAAADAGATTDEEGAAPMQMGSRGAENSSPNGTDSEDTASRADDAALMPPPQPRHQKRGSDEEVAAPGNTEDPASTKRRRA